MDQRGAQQQMFDNPADPVRVIHRRDSTVKARQQAGEGFKPIDAGVHVGVIIGLIDLGKQAGIQRPGLTIKDAYKLAVVVQFPGAINEQGQPHTVTKIYTSSMFARAILRKDVEGLFGKAFPSQEVADEFDFKALLGRVGLFNVQHDAKGDKVFANIVSIMPLPNGMEKPAVDPSNFLLFDLDLTGSDYAAAYAKVPSWLQKKIEGRMIEEPEGGDLAEGDGGGAAPASDDDIPF